MGNGRVFFERLFSESREKTKKNMVLIGEGVREGRDSKY